MSEWYPSTVAAKSSLSRSPSRSTAAPPVDGHLVRLEAEPPGAAADRGGGQRADRAAVDQQFDVGHLDAGLGGVPAVGAEEVPAVGAQQQRAVGPGEPGQVADVEQV